MANNSRPTQTQHRSTATAGRPAGAHAPGTGGNAVVPARSGKLITRFANRYSIDPDQLMKTLKDTAFKQPGKFQGDQWQAGPEVTNEQMVALLVVAEQYKLNPFLKEIYAFASKGGGIVPIIGFDGWINLINSQPTLEYIDIDYAPEGTYIIEKGDQYLSGYWVSCEIKRSDRTRPTKIVEYFDECYRNTDPWNQTGRRMNRHRAIIQCGRIVFGFGGIYDPDTAARIIEGEATEITTSDRAVSRKPETREPQAIVRNPEPEKPAAAAAGQGSLLGDEPSPLAKLKALVDSTGIPQSEVFAEFEVGGFEELTEKQIGQALEFVGKMKP